MYNSNNWYTASVKRDWEYTRVGNTEKCPLSAFSGLILEKKQELLVGTNELSHIRVSLVLGYTVPDKVAEVNCTCVVQALPSFISIH